MQLIKQIFISFRTNRLYYSFLTLLAVLLTGSGLFFQTNLTLNQLMQHRFQQSLQQLKSTTDHALLAPITIARQEQQLFNTVGFWLCLGLFAFLVGVTTWWLMRQQQTGWPSHHPERVSRLRLASQHAITASLSFGIGYIVTVITALICQNRLQYWIQAFNQRQYAHYLSSQTQLSLDQVIQHLTPLFKGRITDFNVYSLIYGRGATDSLLHSLTGYSKVLMLGFTLVFLIHFVGSYLATRHQR